MEKLSNVRSRRISKERTILKPSESLYKIGKPKYIGNCRVLMYLREWPFILLGSSCNLI